jgi:tetratricopeptide (TPR) repeat protein
MYLLTLYCFIRGVTGSRLWHGFGVVAFLLGLAAKEPMVTAPLLVLVFDRTLIGGSFRESLRKRRGFYIGVAVALVPFVVLQLMHPHGPDAGFGMRTLSVFDNLKTQAWAIVRYLRLAIWPSGLVLYYGRADESVRILRRFPEYAPYGCVVVALLGLTLWAICRRRPAGVLGAAFFLILGPSSSIVVMPTEVLAEYRMYLPLIAVISIGVLACDALLVTWFASVRARVAVGAILAATTIASLTVATRHRNQAFATSIAIWDDVARKMPTNVTAWVNLGALHVRRGDIPAAESNYRRAIELNANAGAAVAGLGMIAESRGDFAEAARRFERAIEIDPGSPDSYYNLAMVLAFQQQYGRALEVLRVGTGRIPWDPQLALLSGAMLVRAGHEADGHARLERAIATAGNADDRARTATRAAHLLIQLNLLQAAVRYSEQSAATSNDPQEHLKLGLLYTSQGNVAAAMAEYELVLRHDPDNAVALNNLAWYYATSPEPSRRDGDLAVRYAERLAGLTNRRDAGALDTLAAACAEAGQFDRAVAAAQEAIALSTPQSVPPVADLQSRLALYGANKPFRDQTLTVSAPAAPLYVR